MERSRYDQITRSGDYDSMSPAQHREFWRDYLRFSLDDISAAARATFEDILRPGELTKAAERHSH